MKIPPNRVQGFTLIEMVMVMVITGILAAIITTFMRRPVDAYFDSARRAALTDVADVAVRRMVRDIHKALPNSVRQTDNQCIEFIPTKVGGRYRALTDASGNGDILDFTAPDTSFDMLGLNSDIPIDHQIQPGDMIAVYNLGIAGANAYVDDNITTVSGVGSGDLVNETKISFGLWQFPLASSSNRFHVIPSNDTVVSFICSGGVLYRNSNYSYATSCPAPVPGTTPVLAQSVSYCNFVYNNFELQRNGLVQMTITLTSGGESVNLYHEAHVNNSP